MNGTKKGNKLLAALINTSKKGLLATIKMMVEYRKNLRSYRQDITPLVQESPYLLLFKIPKGYTLGGLRTDYVIGKLEKNPLTSCYGLYSDIYFSPVPRGELTILFVSIRVLSEHGIIDLKTNIFIPLEWCVEEKPHIRLNDFVKETFNNENNIRILMAIEELLGSRTTKKQWILALSNSSYLDFSSRTQRIKF